MGGQSCYYRRSILETPGLGFSKSATTMTRKVKLFTFEEDKSLPELIGPLTLSNVKNYQAMREILSRLSIVAWLFNFWDAEFGCRIPIKLEPFNILGDEVYVVHELDCASRCTKQRRLEAISETEVVEDILEPTI